MWIYVFVRCCWLAVLRGDQCWCLFTALLGGSSALLRYPREAKQPPCPYPGPRLISSAQQLWCLCSVRGCSWIHQLQVQHCSKAWGGRAELKMLQQGKLKIWKFAGLGSMWDSHREAYLSKVCCEICILRVTLFTCVQYFFLNWRSSWIYWHAYQSCIPEWQLLLFPLLLCLFRHWKAFLGVQH